MGKIYDVLDADYQKVVDEATTAVMQQVEASPRFDQTARDSLTDALKEHFSGGKVILPAQVEKLASNYIQQYKQRDDVKLLLAHLGASTEPNVQKPGANR